MFEKGDLSAILLTGVTEDGIELFSNYVERTCDVQTISFILLWSLPNLVHKNEKAQVWVESYKNLLDCWRMWNQRAQFDILWFNRMGTTEDAPQRLYAACTFCAQPIASYLSNDQTGVKTNYQQHIAHHQLNRMSTSNASSSKSRTCTCNNCGKSLPRCCLCLTNLGTAAGVYWRPGLTFSKSDRKLSPCSSWFTWCQSCRHGGHASHLMDWFSENSSCPVVGCKCKCMCLDATAPRN